MIIGLGLIQMTVLARIIDNHQFGLLTVSLVIIALADTISDFGIANSIIQRKTIGASGADHALLAKRWAWDCGICGGLWLSDAIAHVLHNPDLAPLIKTLSLAFIVIPPRAAVPCADAKRAGVQ
ncbi:colanic acid exporter [Salmonella enterica subsp. enterica]|uniref:Colanic acid exporter n=1 Tax=Salmonella enterica I TaxID=59201 RepID=A0A379WSY7_SALET|nr:colanic acid exporter [Salmonella enterica subsp. enterica]